MKNNKVKRMSKAPFIFIIFILLFIVTGYYLKDNKYIEEINKYKLKKVGYNNEEISIIIKDKTSLDYALNNDYSSILTTVINDSNYKKEYLNKYIDYLNKYNGVDIENAIMLINKNDID